MVGRVEIAVSRPCATTWRCLALDLIRLGPQLSSDSPLLKRVRFHQSWYRSEILGIADYGATPPPHSRELGSILTRRHGEGGFNFVSESAQLAYQVRRKLGWGVDPVRCQQYMTSSQALTLNVFGSLFGSMAWLQAVLAQVCDLETGRVRHAAIEFAPKSPKLHLNDRTLVDAYIELEAVQRSISVVVETKLADRFSARFLDVATNPYYERFNDSFGLWNVDAPGFGSRPIDQLARAHALATSAGKSQAMMLLIHHPLDTQTSMIGELYRKTLRDPDKLLIVDLESFFGTMQLCALDEHQVATVQRLRRRYTSFAESESYWEARLP